MLGSLKQYKGATVFVRLAEALPDYRFELVLNENQENIDVYWHVNELPLLENLTVYSRQQNVAPFYNRASIVLNLTDKHYAIETFGLTALEAMSAGLPVIVPTVGGIAEMVQDGENGYKIDVQDFSEIVIKSIIFFQKKHFMINWPKEPLLQLQCIMRPICVRR